MIFQDRTDAGRRLAEHLKRKRLGGGLVVVALPRGGVPVGNAIAARLSAPLDALFVKKVGAPGNPEFALGAVAEDGSTWVNHDVARTLSVKEHELEAWLKQAAEAVQQTAQAFRLRHPPIDVKGRPVILVDDGLATGATLIAAAVSLRKRGAARIVVAVPVASPEGVRLLAPEADEIETLRAPTDFRAVSQWYEDFGQVTDEEALAILEAARHRKDEAPAGNDVSKHEVMIPLGEQDLLGTLSEPARCRGWVIFAHGSGSSRLSPRNWRVAQALNQRGIGTLLFDLLTEYEAKARANVFNIHLLAERLAYATRWVRDRPEWKKAPIGYFGASTGAAAALVCAAFHEPSAVTVVSRGGRPDLAGDALEGVKCPVLLIVGSADPAVLRLNEEARARIPYGKVEVVPGAGHLFEEPGALEKVIELATAWFSDSMGQVEGSESEGQLSA